MCMPARFWAMAGLVGAGRSELARAAFGIDRYQGGLEVDGTRVTVSVPRDAINAGVYLVPEESARRRIDS